MTRNLPLESDTKIIVRIYEDITKLQIAMKSYLMETVI